MAKYRVYLLGLLGLALITFPFLWLQLKPDFTRSTVGIVFAPQHGLKFFLDLSPVLLVFALGWLILQLKRRLGLGQNLASQPAWQAVARGLPVVTPWVVLALAFSGLFFLGNSELDILTSAAIFMLLAVGLNITVGMTGLLVLGYAAFFSFGAYLLALGHQQYPWLSWWLALPLAFVLGGFVGYLLGLPCLRLRGDYLAIVTLGFAEAFRETMRNLECTHGDNGITLLGNAVFPHALFGWNDVKWAYLIILTALTLAVIFVQRLYHSPIGKAWIAIRENEIAAGSVGVPVVHLKLLAFSISAALAAVAGVLYAAKAGYVNPATCDFQTSIMILAMVILGGLGNTYGALLGAALLYLVPEYLKFLPSMIKRDPTLHATIPDFITQALQNLSDYRLLLFGAIMVLMMLYRPQGLLGNNSRKLEMTEGEGA